MTQTEHQLKIDDARQFLFAGNATFTIRSIRTGTRFTFRVRESKQKKGTFFVSYLSGTDNESNYTWFGMIFDRNKFVLGRKARERGISEATPAVAAFIWTFARLNAGVDVPNLEFWHAGKCGRCGRTLTVPGSIETGIGPECAKLMLIDTIKRDTGLPLVGEVSASAYA